jgi:hypothetical protein
MQDCPKIDYERLLPIDTPSHQVSGVGDFMDESAAPGVRASAEAATVLDVASLIDTETLLSFDQGSGRTSTGLAARDDADVGARLRAKAG